MSKTGLLDKKTGNKLFLMGNEAIARGAIEAGLDIAAAYPGTPSSEIGDALGEIVNDGDFYFEYSSNEKVALEVAAAAAACGLRSITFMKHVGLNVAADPFMTTAYIGTEGGFVIVTADDPSLHSSQNEQDNRYYSRLAKLPMLEPSNPQEAKDMTKDAFVLSEKLKLPVILRTTTRVSHVRGPVELSEIQKPRGRGRFEKDPSKKVPVPANAKIMHLKLLEKMKDAKQESENSPYNHEENLSFGSGKKHEISFISSGPAFNYLYDFLNSVKIPSKILKLGFTNPVPEKKIIKFLRENPEVVIVEELEPFLEFQVRSIAQLNGIACKIYGKMDGFFPEYFEFNEDVIKNSLEKILKRKFELKQLKPASMDLPTRPPVLCPGCSHRASYYIALKALKKEKIKDAIFPSDIGCYTLGIQPPFMTADYLLCMGSSTGTPGGFSKSTDQPIVSFIGDSTFFHTGIAGLLNCVHNNHRMILVILDNSTTAMTGHQSHPGMPINASGKDAPHIDLPKLLESMGIDFVKTINPYNVKESVETFREALKNEGVSVIISKKDCCISVLRNGKADKRHTFKVNQEKCKKCGICINELACPAMYKHEEEIRINPAYCFGCSICAQVCTLKAIEIKK